MPVIILNAVKPIAVEVATQVITAAIIAAGVILHAKMKAAADKAQAQSQSRTA